MWFGILGSTEVRTDDGSPVAVGGPRVRSLLAMLLLDPGGVVTVERLIDGLYGEDPPAGAANALQSQVSRLRRALRGDLVEFHPGGYRLAVDPEDVDVHRFQRLAGEGRRELAGGDHERAAALLRAALGLWRGPALADLADAPFADAQNTRLEELRATVTEDLAEAELALGKPRDIIPDLQRLIAQHPLREPARGHLMRALYADGRQAEALTVYEDVRRLLADELGTDPSPGLAEVHLAILRGDPARTSARAAHSTSADARRHAGEHTGPLLASAEHHRPATSDEPHPAGIPAAQMRQPGGVRGKRNIPAQLTSFVGREEELRRVGVILAEQRLLTLIGPGGAGKTRLAVETGALATGEVCFVDLAPLGDGAEVPNALLEALGLRDGSLLPTPGETASDPMERLVTALTGRHMLLILDNCEHVIDAAARLVHLLLRACPDLKVLATGREALGITGESLWPLPPLPLPPQDAPLEQALTYPAVRLFQDRAAAVRPGFTVGGDNIDVVLKICRDLDGLPLAIELAAARMRSLPPAEVAARLDDRFRLLSRGNRAAAPRHQTLRAVVEWSWELLDPAEQTLARRLTAFTGGATMESVERVCEMPGDLLIELVEKSFVHRDPADEDRYRMLETVHAFCAERLREAGEHDRVHQAHAEYFLALAAEADPYLRGADQLDWLARLAAEHANLHAALRRGIRRDPTLALRLTSALSWYWSLRGRVEGAALAAELLNVVGPEPPDDLEEEWVLCVTNASSGSLVNAEDHMDRAEAVLKGIHRRLRWPAVIIYWAMAGGPQRMDMQTHLVHAGEDAWSQTITHLGEGFRYQFESRMDEAEREFEVARQGFAEIGDRWGMANCLDPLAQIADWRGDRERFFALINRALELMDRLGAHEERADLLARRALGRTRDGDYAAAKADYELAAEVARRAGSAEKADGINQGLGEIARLNRDYAGARRHFEAALNALSDDWYAAGWTKAEAMIGLGWTAAAEQNAAEARDLHLRALKRALGHLNVMLACDAVDGLAGAALLDGDGERAAVLLGIAAGLRDTPKSPTPDVARVTARTRARLGDEAFEAAYARGRTMDRDQALTLARGS